MGRFIVLIALVTGLVATGAPPERMNQSFAVPGWIAGPESPDRRITAPVTRRDPVPILMYHVIAPAPRGAPYPGLYVTPARFAEHMAYLDRHRYHVVALQQVWNHWHGGPELPSKPVVVSFDDGSRDWYTNAYPILRRHGWVGTMNLAGNHLSGSDGGNRWVRRLVAAGWELDSHTLTHPDLTQLGAEDLRREVAGSRRKLRRLFGVPVNFFCYPSGRYDRRVIRAVRKSGLSGRDDDRGGGRRSERAIHPETCQGQW